MSKFAHGGAEGQNRTVDTSLFRAVLYQLSYLGTGGSWSREAVLSTGSNGKNQALSGYREFAESSKPGLVAEREGFEPSVEVLAPTTV